MARPKQMLTYNDNYLNLSFSSVEVNGEVRPQCGLCTKVLAHSSLKEAKLRRHFESKYVKYVDENHDFFNSKELQVKRSRIDCLAIRGGVAHSHSKAVQDFFAVAWKVARAKASHTAEENLAKSAASKWPR